VCRGKGRGEEKEREGKEGKEEEKGAKIWEGEETGGVRAWLFASENVVRDLLVVHAVLQRDAVCIAVCCSVVQ